MHEKHLSLAGEEKSVALSTGNLKFQVLHSQVKSQPTITMISPPSPVPGTGVGTLLNFFDFEAAFSDRE